MLWSDQKQIGASQSEQEQISFALDDFDYFGFIVSKSYVNYMFYVTNITDSFPS